LYRLEQVHRPKSFARKSDSNLMQPVSMTQHGGVCPYRTALTVDSMAASSLSELPAGRFLAVGDLLSKTAPVLVENSFDK
jgi:hypothetical protein